MKKGLGAVFPSSLPSLPACPGAELSPFPDRAVFGVLEILLAQFVLLIAAGHQRATSQTSVFEEQKCPLWFGLIFLKRQASLSVRQIARWLTHRPTVGPHLGGISQGSTVEPLTLRPRQTIGPLSAPGTLSPSASTTLDSFPHLLPALGGAAGSWERPLNPTRGCVALV